MMYRSQMYMYMETHKATYLIAWPEQITQVDLIEVS